MTKISLFLVLSVFIIFESCKSEDRFVEPNYVLGRWAKSIEKLNYREYCRYEAYPKTESVFKKMYKDYYILDLMTTDIEEADEKNIRKDQEGNSYLHRALSFEGAVVNRSNKKPYQLLRGNAVFIRYIDGKRKRDGWLISNRTLMRIDK
ncbi:MAG: hypothetical protein SVZ03_14815 [Spirochaetota bacterium]|nr:hypothetical protein [Spirochaetota bacterium]